MLSITKVVKTNWSWARGVTDIVIVVGFRYHIRTLGFHISLECSSCLDFRPSSYIWAFALNNHSSIQSGPSSVHSLGISWKAIGRNLVHADGYCRCAPFKVRFDIDKLSLRFDGSASESALKCSRVR